MLYISTRNVNETFTAYRALNEEAAPDGGMYIPYRIPVFSAAELVNLKSQSFYHTVADVLNLLFNTRISDNEVESAIGKLSIAYQEIMQNVLFAEMWHTPEGSCDFLIKALHRMMTGKVGLPKGWAYIAIEIALLFGIYSTLKRSYDTFDIVVPSDDFADLAAVLYAKDMGLPVKGIICACSENSVAWDLVNKGEFETSGATPYLEYILHRYVTQQDIHNYLDVCARKGVYRLDETYMEQMNAILYVAVVSSGRIGTVISSMLSANSYAIDSETAFAYGGLQDYRASTGTNKRTLILSRKRPERIKE